jgi:hypothetical protein
MTVTKLPGPAGPRSCPSWCTAHIDRAGDLAVSVHQTARRHFRAPSGSQISVAVLQGRGTGQPAMYVSGVRIRLDDAGQMARFMCDLGLSEVADAITEMAALVTAGNGAR